MKPYSIVYLEKSPQQNYTVLRDVRFGHYKNYEILSASKIFGKICPFLDQNEPTLQMHILVYKTI